MPCACDAILPLPTHTKERIMAVSSRIDPKESQVSINKLIKLNELSPIIRPQTIALLQQMISNDASASDVRNAVRALDGDPRLSAAMFPKSISGEEVRVSVEALKRDAAFNLSHGLGFIETAVRQAQDTASFFADLITGRRNPFSF
jgi:hypothetical protein